MLEGVVESAEVKPETVDREIIKLMRVVQIIRTPNGRIANLEMNLKSGPLSLEVDEATAGAIWNVFVEDRKAKP